MCADLFPLRDVIGPALSISDVSAVTGLSKSTLSRLWDDSDWIGSAHRQTVHRLEMVIPAVHQYVERHAQVERLVEAVNTARRADLEVDPGAVVDLGRHLPPVTLALVLDAAAAFAQNDIRRGFRRLDLCWGAQVDPCVSLLFDGDLIGNRSRLLTRLAGAVTHKSARHAQHHANVGHSIIVHKLIKFGFDINLKMLSTDNPAAMAFQTRSRAVANIFATGDPVYADKLHSFTKSDELNSTNEIWSLASYSGDVAVGKGPVNLPTETILAKTASDILADLQVQNGAYALYLAQTAIPLILRRDPSFAGRRNALVRTLIDTHDRAEDAQGDRALSKACRATAQLAAGHHA